MPFAGTTKAAIPYVSGYNGGIFIVDPRLLRPAERTFSSLAALLPHAKVFKPTQDILIQTPSYNYTAASYAQLFARLNDPVGQDMWKDTRPYIDRILTQHPGVDVHCFVGTQTPTVKGLVYERDGAFPDGPYNEIDGDGDGTVNLESAQYCLNWAQRKRNPLGKPLDYREFPGIGHGGLATNNMVIDAIIEALKQPSLTSESIVY